MVSFSGTDITKRSCLNSIALKVAESGGLNGEPDGSGSCHLLYVVEVIDGGGGGC